MTTYRTPGLRLRVAWLACLTGGLLVPGELRPGDAAGPDEASGKQGLVELRGEVLPYREALDAAGIEVVGDWGNDLLALRTKEGKVLPLLPTQAARFFYQDEQNWRRPFEIVARPDPKVPGVHVIRQYAIKNGKPYESYYWCGVCAIKFHQLQGCDCCQGDLEHREHPKGERYRFTND